MDKGIVDVTNRDAAALKFGTEEGVLVTIVGAGFVETDFEEGGALNEERESRELGVGVLAAKGCVAPKVGMTFVAVAQSDVGSGKCFGMAQAAADDEESRRKVGSKTIYNTD